MLKSIRRAIALLMLSATFAHAGTSVVAVLGKNDGGRWNIGKQGAFGSSWKASSGVTLMAWVKMGDQTVTPIMAVFSTGAEGATGVGNQFMWWMLNATWTTDYSLSTNHVIVQFSDDQDSGYFFGHKAISSPDFDDTTNWYHHALSCTMNGTGSPPSPAHVCTWYVNGVASSGSWTETFGQAAVGTLHDYANDLYIGAHRKNGGAIVDYSTFKGADFRTYTRALSADEINQIYKMKGRDMIRKGLVSRYTFWTDGTNSGPNGVAATAEHSSTGSDPTIETDKFLQGRRRKVM